MLAGGVGVVVGRVGSDVLGMMEVAGCGEM